MYDLLVGETLDAVVPIVLRVALAGVAIYAVTVVTARIGGARTLASVSAFDFIANVAVGAMVGTVVVTPSVGLVNGAVGVTVVFALQLVIGYAREYEPLRRAIDDRPTLVFADGEVLHDNLSATRLTEIDLHSAMRANNVHHVADVDAIVLEKTGMLSVLHHGSSASDVDDVLLSGMGAELDR